MKTEELRIKMNELYEKEGLSKAFKLAHGKYLSSLNRPQHKPLGYATGKKAGN